MAHYIVDLLKWTALSWLVGSHLLQYHCGSLKPAIFHLIMTLTERNNGGVTAFKLAVKNNPHPSRRDCWERERVMVMMLSSVNGRMVIFLHVTGQTGFWCLWGCCDLLNKNCSKCQAQEDLCDTDQASTTWIHFHICNLYVSCTVCGYTLLCNYDTGVWHPAKKKRKKSAGGYHRDGRRERESVRT